MREQYELKVSNMNEKEQSQEGNVEETSKNMSKDIFKDSSQNTSIKNISKANHSENGGAENDDVALDLGKVKKWFASKEKSMEKSMEQSTHHYHSQHHSHSITDNSLSNSTETDIDLRSALKKAGKFYSQYKHLLIPVLFLALAIFFAVSVRMTSMYLSATDDWARGSVMNQVQEQIKGSVNSQYPNLPDANKQALVNEQLQKVLVDANQKTQIEAQIMQLSAYFKSKYQYEEKGKIYTYMPDIDPYIYLRYARNILTKGHVGDVVVNGVQIDNHFLAPQGITLEFDVHPYVLAWIYKIMSIFKPNIPLMQAAGYFPIIFAIFAVIPAFFLGRKLGGNLSGLFAALLVGVNIAGVGRTLWGHADTDAYNLFFPMLIMWMFAESLMAKTEKKQYIYAALSGLSVGIYSATWDGWWYIFDFLLGAMAIQIVYKLMHETLISKKLFSEAIFSSGVKNAIISAIILIIISGAIVSVVHSMREFALAPLNPIHFSNIKNAAKANYWPNVYTTVAELNPASTETIINAVGGPWAGSTMLFYLAGLGVLLVLLRKDAHGHYDVGMGALLVMWFAGTFYASLKGTRFTLLLVPPFSIAIGAAIGIIHQKAGVWLKKTLGIKQIITTVLIILIFGSITFVLISKAYDQGKGDIPLINDAWYDSLTAIKNNSSENAIINSWWDFGHHFKYIADRAVTFDGASQNKPPAHWIGEALLAENEDEAIGILRMLDCGSNNAIYALDKTFKDTVKTHNVLHKIILQDKETARQTLSSMNIRDTEAVLKYTHCTPPEDFFITSDDMVGKSGVWGHFGSWSFEKAYAWLTLKNQPREDAINYMIENWSYTRENAEKMYSDVKSITTEDQANAWISPWPGYYGGIANCKLTNEQLLCENGLVINTTTEEPFIQSQGGLTKLNKLVALDQTQKYTVREFTGGREDLSALIFQTKEGVRSMLMHPLLSNSVFTKLFFLEGHGLKKFKLFSTQRQVTGGMIYVWKVDWSGKTPNIHSSFIEKTTANSGDIAVVNYIGAFENGTVFDSSIQNWKDKNLTLKTSFPLTEKTNLLQFGVGNHGVIPGFEQAVIGMTVGSEKTVTIPPENAYGTDPTKHVLGNKTLVFKIKLEKVQ